MKNISLSTYGFFPPFSCSDGYNFNIFKNSLEENVNSQGREQMHSIIEKCAQSLRLMSYRHYMIFMYVFFAVNNLQNRRKWL